MVVNCLEMLEAALEPGNFAFVVGGSEGLLESVDLMLSPLFALMVRRLHLQGELSAGPLRQTLPATRLIPRE